MIPWLVMKKTRAGQTYPLDRIAKPNLTRNLRLFNDPAESLAVGDGMSFARLLSPTLS
jgi:hypothetical protein